VKYAERNLFEISATMESILTRMLIILSFQLVMVGRTTPIKAAMVAKEGNRGPEWGDLTIES